jgi:hypothetical protein
MSWVPSVEQHDRIAGAIRLARLEAEIAAELDGLAGELSEAQRAGRACAQCGREDGPLHGLLARGDLSLVLCPEHDAAER